MEHLDNQTASMTNQKRVLVIYETIPEKTVKTVALLDDSDYQQLKKADGFFVNSSEYDQDASDAALAIMWAFYDKEGKDYSSECETDLQKKLYATFKDMDSAALTEALRHGVDGVIHAGFYL